MFLHHHQASAISSLISGIVDNINYQNEGVHLVLDM